jgi:hypothetical protein
MTNLDAGLQQNLRLSIQIQVQRLQWQKANFEKSTNDV